MNQSIGTQLEPLVGKLVQRKQGLRGFRKISGFLAGMTVVLVTKVTGNTLSAAECILVGVLVLIFVGAVSAEKVLLSWIASKRPRGGLPDVTPKTRG